MTYNFNNSGRDHVSGLGLSHTNVTTIAIATGRCKDSTNTVDMVNGSAIALAITASGVNGLDTGSESSGATTFYSVWLISGAGQTTAGLLSTHATSPTMPTDYTHKRRIGYVVNHSDNNLQDFVQSGNGNERTYHWRESGSAYARPLNNTASDGSDTQVSVAAFVAPTAHTMIVRMVATAGGGAVVDITCDDAASVKWCKLIENASKTLVGEMPCGVNKSFTYQTANPATLQVNIRGWKEAL